MQSIDGNPLSHHGAIAAGQEYRRAANRRTAARLKSLDQSVT
jgi:hypothetical protein